MSISAAIVKRIKELPTLSVVVSRLLEVTRDPTTGAADIEAVFASDPALTANVLRLANSPLLGVVGGVRSVRHAVVVLGAKRLFDLAAGVGLSRTLPAQLPGYDVSAHTLFQHCVAVAVLAEKLAIEAGKPM